MPRLTAQMEKDIDELYRGQLADSRMTAERARRLVASVKQRLENIDALIDYIDKKINAAASKGLVAVQGVFDGVRMPVSSEQKRLVKEHYVRQGFCWHCTPTETISWPHT